MVATPGPAYDYRRPPEMDGAGGRCAVAIVGAGPVGLVAAIDLAQHGVRAIVLDDDCTVSAGSRAICYAKRTLEILDRLGCGERVARRGVQWNVGRVFAGAAEAYRFELLRDAGHRRPAFVNLQQHHFERYLVERAAELGVELRGCSEVTEVTQAGDAVTLGVTTPEGRYPIEADWVVVADGARSPVRRMLGLGTIGQVFNDRFLIADIRMQPGFPTERWFWFDPPFHRGQSVLLHRQADDIWRVDFQLGPDADPDAERRPERILPRLRAMLGEDATFELEWASVYTFQCRRMERFRHGRLLFAGDAAHLVSPFGARGANSGMQDADNLAWKLALVVQGRAPPALLDSYDAERVPAADENIRHSTRATDFISPKSAGARVIRDAVLDLARKQPFARRLVNTGRLSVPAILRDSPLSTADEPGAFDPAAGSPAPGTPAPDAPVDGPRGAWLLDYLGGCFTLLVFGPAPPGIELMLARGPFPCTLVCVDPGAVAPESTIRDRAGVLAQRYDAQPGTCYLFRPDQHVCARFRALDVSRVHRAIARATCTD